MATDRETIKTWFETGDTPTEAQFAEALDSYVHQDDLSDVAKESSEKNIENKVLDNNSKLVAIAQELNTITTAVNSISASMYKGWLSRSATDNVALPNVLNIWSNVTENITITKGAEISGVVNEYAMRVTANGGVPSFSWGGAEIKWYGGSVPTFTSGKIYEINIVDNIALWAEV